MSSHSFSADSPQDLRRAARFMEELDIAIREANRELLGKHLPALDHHAFFRLSVGVAKLRVAYLEALLAIDWHDPQETVFADLAKRRVMYEEAKSGFDALRHAVEKGYAPLHDDQA
jgi:hypothetical protein